MGQQEVYDFLKKHRGKWFAIGLKLVIIIAILATAIIVSSRFFLRDIDNARYFLSAIAQSQAAIIGLTVAFLFISIQLFSQIYSFRLIEKIIRNIKFWIVISVFIISILLDFFLLAVLSNDELTKFSMSLSWAFMLLSFILLIDFLWSIQKIINPKNIIRSMSEGLKKKSVGILKRICNQKKMYDYVFLQLREETEISPLLDIVNVSIKRGDYNTSIIGLKEIQEFYSYLFFNLNKFNIKELMEHQEDFIRQSERERSRINEFRYNLFKELILQDFNNHILDVWRVAINNNDEAVINTILEATKEVYSSNNESLQASNLCVYDVFLKVYHRDLLEKSLLKNIDHNIKILMNLGEEIIVKLRNEEDHNVSSRLIEVLKEISSQLLGNSYFIDTNRELVKFLSRFCVYATKKDMVNEYIETSELIKQLVNFFFMHQEGLGFIYSIRNDLVQSCKNLIINKEVKYFREYFDNTLLFIFSNSVYSQRIKGTITPLLRYYAEAINELALFSIEAKENFDIIFEKFGNVILKDCSRGGNNVDILIKYFDDWASKKLGYRVDFNRFVKEFVKRLAITYINAGEKVKEEYKKTDDDIDYSNIPITIWREFFAKNKYKRLAEIGLKEVEKDYLPHVFESHKDNYYILRKKLGELKKK